MKDKQGKNFESNPKDFDKLYMKYQHKTWNNPYIMYNFLENFDKPTALDVGCGQGYTTKLLSQKYNIIGVDISNKAIEFAKKNYPDLTFQVGSIENVYGSFDTIFFINVLNYFTEEQFNSLMPDLIHKMNPGGEIVGVFYENTTHIADKFHSLIKSNFALISETTFMNNLYRKWKAKF